MGVSLSVYSTVTRLLNSPLLSVTTTAVASALGRSDGAHLQEPITIAANAGFWDCAGRLNGLLYLIKALRRDWTWQASCPCTGQDHCDGKCAHPSGRLGIIQTCEGQSEITAGTSARCPLLQPRQTAWKMQSSRCCRALTWRPTAQPATPQRVAQLPALMRR